MNLNNLRDVLIVKLRALYDVEKQISHALPKMIKVTKTEELKTAWSDHLKETKQQLNRLEQAFKLLEHKAQGLRSEGIRGIIADAEWLMDQKADPYLLEAALVAAAQKVEHYEIADYGSAIAWSESLGEEQVADLLAETLAEEKAADEKLSNLAETLINNQAEAML